jgi:hypothetical protein
MLKLEENSISCLRVFCQVRILISEHCIHHHQMNSSFESNSIKATPCNPSHAGQVSSSSRRQAKQANHTETGKSRKAPAGKRIKKSPSYLLFLMKSMSRKRRPNVLRAIVKSEERIKSTSRGTTGTTSCSDQSSGENFYFDTEERSMNELVGVSSIKTNHFAKLANPSASSQSENDASDLGVSSALHGFIKNKQDISHKISNRSKEVPVGSLTEAVKVTAEINTEAIEFLFNCGRNMLFLSILLLVVWPVNIILRVIWLVHKYVSNLFPNLEHIAERVDKWHGRASQLEESLLDRISFLN